MTQFTLTVATSRDGFICRTTDEPPQAWASPEEQALFFRDVEAADWAIIGRNTHLAADKPHRHRIVFSSTASGWQRPTQLWLDPKNLSPRDLGRLVDNVHPFEQSLILGGTRVHDWFLNHGRIDRVHLTIEPVSFGDGLPVFSTQTSQDPVEIFRNAGFEVQSDAFLNAQGTRYFVLEKSN